MVVRTDTTQVASVGGNIGFLPLSIARTFLTPSARAVKKKIRPLPFDRGLLNKHGEQSAHVWKVVGLVVKPGFVVMSVGRGRKTRVS
jgi:hypothetical protein